jgi:DNA-binding winged helix-turn-helix (wHTH) protein
LRTEEALTPEAPTWTPVDARPSREVHMLSFGPIVVDTVTDLLTVSGRARPVAPTPLRILKYLLVHAGRSIGRDEIEREILRVHHRQGSSHLRNHIAELRVALGAAGSEVRSVPGGWSIGADGDVRKR